MPLLINIRQVQSTPLHLQGELACAAMDWDTRDEMIRVSRPLEYDLEAQKVDGGILVQGRLRQPLDCECVRCLKAFVHEVRNDNWNCLLALQGEEKALVVNDCVDLTPYLREDIFLAFPQHPLCGPQCDGLARSPRDEPADGGSADAGSSVWNELNKLKF